MQLYGGWELQTLDLRTLSGKVSALCPFLTTEYGSIYTTVVHSTGYLYNRLCSGGGLYGSGYHIQRCFVNEEQDNRKQSDIPGIFCIKELSTITLR